MPTSYGLSYSTNSLPRSACTTGACSRSATATSSSCAPWQPAPARIVTASGRVEQVGRGGELVVARAGRPDAVGRTAVTARRPRRRARNTSPGIDQDGDAPALDRRPHRDLQEPRQLLRDADQLGVDAALAEQLLRVGLLEVAGADLRPRDVRGERQHRNPAALGVEQAVDQVQVARAAARRADRELHRWWRPRRPRRRRPPPRAGRAATRSRRRGGARRSGRSASRRAARRCGGRPRPSTWRPRRRRVVGRGVPDSGPV